MTQDNKSNFRPLPFLLMIVVLIALAAGGWWVKTHSTDTLNTAGITTPSTGQTGIDATQHELTLYLPNNNAMLEKSSVAAPTGTASDFVSQAKAAIAVMQEKSPDDFPSGTQLLDVKTGGDGTAVLNFNAKFTDGQFWQGSARTNMTIYSIVNTITAISADDFQAQQVQFQVEGKPIEVLGEFDAHDPLEPDMQWVDQH